MSFADELRRENKPSFFEEKKHAINTMVEVSKSAVKNSCNIASREGFNQVRGYVCYVGVYDDSDYYLVNQWDYYKGSSANGTVNIYRVDRLEIQKRSVNRTMFSFYHPKHKGIANKEYYYLTNEDFESLVDGIRMMLQNLGFRRFSVCLEDKQFFLNQEKEKNGIFGKNTIDNYVDDGVGKVINITVGW